MYKIPQKILLSGQNVDTSTREYIFLLLNLRYIVFRRAIKEIFLLQGEVGNRWRQGTRWRRRLLSVHVGASEHCWAAAPCALPSQCYYFLLLYFISWEDLCNSKPQNESWLMRLCFFFVSGNTSTFFAFWRFDVNSDRRGAIKRKEKKETLYEFLISELYNHVISSARLHA